ncbi:MAG: ATP-binding cassette domain-containing protein [Eggerthellaceae bacterium]
MTHALVLSLSHIEYTYPRSAEPVFGDITTTFTSGWTGIIGNNGCGKSTLAHIVCGILHPTKGSLTPKLTSTYCTQDATKEPSALFDFACDYSPDAIHLRTSLNIHDDMLWRFSELSTGEQKKIQVAVALWMDPQVLVLDEPTNHVDATCRKELIHILSQYKGIGVLISHDRALLDSLVEQCLCFEPGNIIMRPGTYCEAKKQANSELRSLQQEKQQQKARVEKLKKEHEDRARKAAQSSARRSARHLDKHDSDGRAKIGLAIVSGQDGKRATLARRMDDRLSRERAGLSSTIVPKEYASALWLETEPCARKTLLHVPAHNMTTLQGHLISVPAITLENTTHLGIKGANGIGKTTLITELHRSLAQQNERMPLRMLYLEQEVTQRDREEIARKVAQLDKEERGRLLSIVAQLNSDPEQILAGCTTSPGEARKIMLAYGIMMHPELIIMDEPTNHLDMNSIEALEKALRFYPGALILVSHDEAFMNAIVHDVIELKS